MLVLSRNIGEVLHVGEQIRVITLAIQGNQVSIGIDAPREVVIVREEIQKHGREAKE